MHVVYTKRARPLWPDLFHSFFLLLAALLPRSRLALTLGLGWQPMCILRRKSTLEHRIALDAIHRFRRPTLLSTRSIVVRGRSCFQRTRPIVSCRRTYSRGPRSIVLRGQPCSRCDQSFHGSQLALDAIYRFTGSTLSFTPCYLSFHRVELAHSPPTPPHLPAASTSRQWKPHLQAIVRPTLRSPS